MFNGLRYVETSWQEEVGAAVGLSEDGGALGALVIGEAVGWCDVCGRFSFRSGELVGNSEGIMEGKSDGNAV